MTAGREDVAAIGAMLAAEPRLDRALELLLTHARRLTRAEAGTVYVRDPHQLWFAVAQNDILGRRLGAEAAQRVLTGELLPLEERSIASYVALTRATVNLPDAYQIPLDRPYEFDRRFDDRLGYRTRSMLAMPLRDARGRAWGVIQLINATNEAGDVVPFDGPSESLVASLVPFVSHVTPPDREEPE